MRLFVLAVALSVSLVGCATTLPSWPSSYATRAIRPDLSYQVFWLLPDKMRCEESAKNLSSFWAFAPCVRAELETGSEFWAIRVNYPGQPIVIGSTAKQYCEQEAAQLIGPWARCVPTNIRFLDGKTQ